MGVYDVFRDLFLQFLNFTLQFLHYCYVIMIHKYDSVYSNRDTRDHYRDVSGHDHHRDRHRSHSRERHRHRDSHKEREREKRKSK